MDPIQNSGGEGGGDAPPSTCEMPAQPQSLASDARAETTQSTLSQQQLHLHWDDSSQGTQQNTQTETHHLQSDAPQAHDASVGPSSSGGHDGGSGVQAHSEHGSNTSVGAEGGGGGGGGEGGTHLDPPDPAVVEQIGSGPSTPVRPSNEEEGERDGGGREGAQVMTTPNTAGAKAGRSDTPQTPTLIVTEAAPGRAEGAVSRSATPPPGVSSSLLTDQVCVCVVCAYIYFSSSPFSLPSLFPQGP